MVYQTHFNLRPNASKRQPWTQKTVQPYLFQKIIVNNSNYIFYNLRNGLKFHFLNEKARLLVWSFHPDRMKLHDKRRIRGMEEFFYSFFYIFQKRAAVNQKFPFKLLINDQSVGSDIFRRRVQGRLCYLKQPKLPVSQISRSHFTFKKSRNQAFLLYCVSFEHSFILLFHRRQPQKVLKSSQIVQS